jgi:hypothetical protein
MEDCIGAYSHPPYTLTIQFISFLPKLFLKGYETSSLLSKNGADMGGASHWPHMQLLDLAEKNLQGTNTLAYLFKGRSDESLIALPPGETSALENLLRDVGIFHYHAEQLKERNVIKRCTLWYTKLGRLAGNFFYIRVYLRCHNGLSNPGWFTVYWNLA